MARLWAKRVSFESVNVGDQLPILVKSESRDSIDRFNRLVWPVGSTGDSDLDPDGEANNLAATGSGVTPGPALVAYVAELLEKAFPLTAILAKGSRLEVEAIQPVQAGDTVALSGQVVGKREDGDHRLVECEILVENQAGQPVARGSAVVQL
jgi:hypothetical protein